MVSHIQMVWAQVHPCACQRREVGASEEQTWGRDQAEAAWYQLLDSCGFWFSGGGPGSSLQPVFHAEVSSSCHRARVGISIAFPLGNNYLQHSCKSNHHLFLQRPLPWGPKDDFCGGLSLCEYSIWRHKVLILLCGFWFTFWFFFPFLFRFWFFGCFPVN